MNTEIKKRGRPKVSDPKIPQTFGIKKSLVHFLKQKKDYNNFINELILNSNEFKNYINSGINKN